MFSHSKILFCQMTILAKLVLYIYIYHFFNWLNRSGNRSILEREYEKRVQLDKLLLTCQGKRAQLKARSLEFQKTLLVEYVFLTC